MRIATIVGVVLIIAGTAGLIWGGFEVPRNEQIAEIGSVELEARTTKQIEIPTWLAGVTLVGGIVLVGVGARKR